MNKTVQALDELVSSIITLVPTWLSMLKSTRVLTIIGTGAIMYFTATQGGLTESQAMIVQIAEAALGVSFIGFKTLRSSTPEPVSTPVSVPVSTSAEPPVISEPEKPVDYAQPFDVKTVLLGSNSFLSWENFQDLRSGLNLTEYHPDVRLDFAEEIENEEKARLDLAWSDNMKDQNAINFVAPPTANDINGYKATEQYKKKVMDAIPGCEWVSEKENMMITGYSKVYGALRNIALLKGKAVNWNKVNTIEDICQLGLKAIG